MKKLLLAISCLLLIIPTTVHAANSIINIDPPKEKLDTLTEEQNARIKALKIRVAEIQAIDRSGLSKADRKELRQELKALKKEAKSSGSGKGFILAIGGIVIIILLLILLL